MPINREEKILFVHIPRTGGTSIEKALGIHGNWREPDFDILFGKDDRGRLLQHLAFGEIRDILEVNLVEYFKFAVIREPLDKLLSEYFRFLRGKSITWWRFLEEAKLARQTSIQKQPHYRPQSQFISEELDKIYLFENLAQVFSDLDQLCNKKIRSRHDNSTSRNIDREEFIQRYPGIVRRLKDFYQEDFELYARLSERS